MRKTEISLGITAGALGIVLGLLSLFGVLPYRSDTFIPHIADTAGIFSMILIAVNVVGIAAAMTVKKRHVLGSVIMIMVMLAVLVLGFPWQSLPAVVYIMSVVMALVPVKAIQ